MKKQALNFSPLLFFLIGFFSSGYLYLCVMAVHAQLHPTEKWMKNGKI